VSGVRVGATLPQFTGNPERLIDGARRAEACGLDSIWPFDHLWPLSGGRGRPLLECWTSLAYIAAVTERITVGTLVTRSSMRHPAVLAKIAATANEIAPGRLVVAVGSGDALSRPENESVGLPYHGGRARVEQLASTVAVLRKFFDGEEVDQADAFVNLRAFPRGPRSSPPPPMWVAGRGEAALRIAATLADGWNGWGGTPEEYARDCATVRALADGRRVEATWAGLVVLAPTLERAREKLGSRPSNAYIAGDSEAVRDRLAGFVAAGAEHIIATFPDSGTPGNFEALAEMKALF
jgi:alkanesulfonate monooxygenase SsuD/methylene tetrahydromethanopterin reductase-like flavin-dependent oxidoreductase (luciferase family)